MSRGRPGVSWLRQVESLVKNMILAGLPSAYAMVKRRPKKYCRNVDAHAENEYRLVVGEKDLPNVCHSAQFLIVLINFSPLGFPNRQC